MRYTTALLLVILAAGVALGISSQGHQVVQRVYLGADTTGSYLENDPYGLAVTNSASATSYYWVDAWDDLRIRLETAGPSAATPAYSLFIDNTRAYKFSTGEYVTFAAQLPHTWKEGSTIEFHAHWSPEDANSGNVTFELQYTCQSISGGAFPSTTTVPKTDAVGGVALAHQMTSIADITMTGKTVSSILMCRFGRIAAGDTYGSEVYVHEVDFHFKRDSNGSRSDDMK